MRPIALTDEQLDSIMAIASALHPTDRPAFLEALAARLNGISELGDGVLNRAAKETARQFFRPPDLGNPRRLGAGKYR
jgi:hypothetical protein